MRMLITGANGFLGRNLKEYFETKYSELLSPRRQELNLLDSNAVSDYIKKNRIDVIIHCAVTLESVEQNLKMFFNIERLSDFFGKMICIGSGAEYDMRSYSPKMTESLFCRNIPEDIYGFSKYVIAKNIEHDPKNIFNLRVFGIYGKYENYHRRFISNNICRVLAGQKITINKNIFFDYLYVRDFLNLVERFIQSEPKEKTYNLCTSSPVDFVTLANIIKEVDGRSLEIILKQEGLGVEYSGDNAKFLKEFGDYKFTEHRDAIFELYDWYKNNEQINFKALTFN